MNIIINEDKAAKVAATADQTAALVFFSPVPSSASPTAGFDPSIVRESFEVVGSGVSVDG